MSNNHIIPHGESLHLDSHYSNKGKIHNESDSQDQIELFNEQLENSLLNKTDQLVKDVASIFNANSFDLSREIVVHFSEKVESFISEIKNNPTFTVENTKKLNDTIKEESAITEKLVDQTQVLIAHQKDVAVWLKEIQKTITLDHNKKRIKYLHTSLNSSIESYISLSNTVPSISSKIPKTTVPVENHPVPSHFGIINNQNDEN